MPPSDRSRLPRTVVALGLVSLLMDISSESVHGILPLFLVNELGASIVIVGLIEGIGEASSLAMKVVSGPLSDWWGKRKPFVLFGYAMGAVAKPLFALAAVPSMALGARIFDRVGKGIRGAPRDALLADAAPPELRGAAYGLRQSMDNVGAFLGPLLAMALMWLTAGNYRAVFWLAAIPGFLAVLAVVLGVSEAEGPERRSGLSLSFQTLKEFPSKFWYVAAVGGVFQLARFSEAFLILRAQGMGLALALAPLVLVAMNIIYTFAAYPIGRASDHMPRERLLLLGAVVLIGADFCLAFGSSLPVIFLGILLWGLHLGLTQGVLSALVADASPAALRGTGFGLFNLVSALALLLASAFAGYLWDARGPGATFLVAAGFAFLSVLALLPSVAKKDSVAR